MSLGGQYNLNQDGNIVAEIGISGVDLNRYSTLDDRDNTGIATQFSYKDQYKLNRSWYISPNAQFEFTGNEFRPIDPYRNPEFSRDWSLAVTNDFTQEFLPSAGITIGKGKSIISNYHYDYYERKNQFEGHRHNVSIRYDTSGLRIEVSNSWLNAASLTHQSKFSRPKFLAEKVILKKSGWKAGISHVEDINITRSINLDSLSLLSFEENKTLIYLENPVAQNMHLAISYLSERPRRPLQNDLRLSEKTREWKISGFLHQIKNFNFDYSLIQRDVIPQNGFTIKRTSNLLGRADISAELFKKLISWNTGYEIGSGQEPKTEFKYVRVQKGEGNFIWVDDGDGIEKIQEFELAPFADLGEYIRLNVFNNQYIRTRVLSWQQAVNIDLSKLTSALLLKRINLTSSYQINRKIRDDLDRPYWNPFYDQYPDTAIVSSSSLWRNILQWNRSDPNYDIQFSYVRNNQQYLQTSGFEEKGSMDAGARLRINLQHKTDFILTGRAGKKMSSSQFYVSRTYVLEQTELKPEINLIIHDQWRLTSSYQFLFQRNESGPEHYHSHRFTLEGVYRKSVKADIGASLSLVNIDYQSFQNPVIDLAILQGLQPGNNLLWMIRSNFKLNATLLLTLAYNGRDTNTEKTIHTGSAQVRATF